MSMKHQLLAASYYPVRFVNIILSHVAENKGKRLRVLIYHDISPNDEKVFSAQLDWLRRTWSFISPSDFEAILLGHKAIDKDSLLLTFDDGFSSNRNIAESVLNPRGIKAIFFVVSEFVSLVDRDHAKEFIAQYICPEWGVSDVPAHYENMSWNDLEYLLENGHLIGAHTGRHIRLSQCAESELHDEIINCADLIEDKLGIQIEHFAYTFGGLDSISKVALSIARSRFKYIYTGLRGNNDNMTKLWSIRRDAVTPRDSHALLGAVLEGGADVLYRSDISEYESWGE